MGVIENFPALLIEMKRCRRRETLDGSSSFGLKASWRL
jgi:hypothetical protein